MFKTLHVYASRFFNESTVDSFLINSCLINPLISYVGVRIIKADKEATIVRLKVNRRTKNHLQSMYMGGYWRRNRSYFLCYKILRAQRS